MAQLSIQNNFWRERKAEAESNRGPSAYLSNTLQLGHTCSLTIGWSIDRLIDWLIDWYRFNIALFSASEQTDCALLARDSKWMTVALHGVLNVHRSAVRTALLACCMTGATGFCCHFGARSVHTTQPCTSLQCYSKPQWLTWAVVFKCMLGYLSVFIIHRILHIDFRIFKMHTWSFCMRIHGGPRLIVSSEGLL